MSQSLPVDNFAWLTEDELDGLDISMYLKTVTLATY